MIETWKETLLPGTQVDARSKRTFTITSADVKAAARNINRMVEKGRKIPLVWEHLDVEESDPEEWKRKYAQGTFGWVGGARLSTAADVSAGIALAKGTLLVRHDIHDLKDAEQLKKTGYVSPKIYRGYLDSQGEEYLGLTVAHVAASPTVCQWWQRPFSINLSDSDALYLSYAPPDGDSSESPKCPPYREDSDDWLAGLELSTTEPETAEDEPVADEKPEPPKKGDDEGGADADFSALVKALKAKGMNISDRVKDIAGLIIAVESSGDAAPEEEIPDELPPPPDEATATAGGPPMMMSTLDRDAKKRERAQAAAKPEREDASKDINTLFSTGRIDGPKKRALLRRTGSVEMSFTKTGEAAGDEWTALLAEIADLKKKPQHSAWKPDGKGGAIDMSATEVVPLPKPAGTSADDDNNPVLKLQRELAAQLSVTPPKK